MTEPLDYTGTPGGEIQVVEYRLDGTHAPAGPRKPDYEKELGWIIGSLYDAEVALRALPERRPADIEALRLVNEAIAILEKN